MNTATAAPARFSVNVRTHGLDVAPGFAAIRSAAEAAGATSERGFGNIIAAQLFCTNTAGATLAELVEAVEAVAPAGATVRVRKLK